MVYYIPVFQEYFKTNVVVPSICFDCCCCCDTASSSGNVVSDLIVAYMRVYIALIYSNGHINLITVHSEIARLSFINICTKKIYRTSIHFDFQILFPIFRRTNKCLFHVFVDVVEFCRNCTRTKLG